MTSAAMPDASTIYRFGLFELDAGAGELRREGVKLALQEQPLALLILLLERAGAVVGREEIRQRLWPPGVHVGFDHGLNAAVRRLREVLGDAAANPRFVATAPRRGYRFIAPVERVERGGFAAAAAAGAARAERHRMRPGPLLAAGLVLALGVVLGLRLGGPGADGGGGLSAAGERVMLAVLPFANLSGDPEQDFLGDGLTDELIARLGSLAPERLGVIARTSVMRYRAAGVPVDRVGRELGVDYVLEGAVRREGEAVRITSSLVATRDQTPVWSATFNRRMAGLFDLQREIASEVAGSLALELVERPATGTPAAAPSPRAAELYLRGRYFWNRRTREGFERALAAFREALEEDPGYAAAYRGLADTYALLGAYDFLRPGEAAQPAREAALTALELDPASAEGYATLGYLLFAYDRDWQGAEANLTRALELNPSLTGAHQAYGVYLSAMGRHDEAVAELEEARRLDPLSLVIQADLAWTLFRARRFEAAAEACRQALELDPGFLVAWDDLKWIAVRMGDEDLACRAFARVVELEGEPPDTVEEVGRLCREEGLPTVLMGSATALLHRAEKGYVSPYDLALDFAALGKVEEALGWLERSYAEGETDLTGLAVDPRLDVLRADRRFQDLVARVGLPPAG